MIEIESIEKRVEFRSNNRTDNVMLGLSERSVTLGSTGNVDPGRFNVSKTY